MPNCRKTSTTAAAWGINWATEDPDSQECFVRKADAEEIVTIEVEMQAFGGGKIRSVVIPAAEGVGQTTESPFWRDPTTDQKLDHTFYYGQNDFQPVTNHCSVGVGDVQLMQDRTTPREKGSGTGSASTTTTADPFDLAGARLQDIPSTRDEVIAASQVFSEKRLLLGQDATEAAFKAQPLADFETPIHR